MPEKLIYIVGVGRSGTSLLQSMFAAHPTITSLPETAFIRRYVATGLLDSIYRAGGEPAAIRQLQTDNYFQRTGLNAKALTQQFDGGQYDAALYKTLLATVKHNDHHYVLDKDPRAIEFLPVLKAVAPEAIVIHMIRDPRDVLASKTQAAWSKSGHPWKHIFANRVQLRLGRTLGSELFGKHYREVIYEELLTEPENVLNNLCHSLDMDYHPDMLRFADAAKTLVADDEMSWKKETLGPLLRSNTGKWRERLDAKTAALTETCCHEAMRHGNYPADSTRSLALTEHFWVGAGRLAITAATRPYMLYRNFKLKPICRRIN